MREMRRRGGQWLFGPDGELYSDATTYERAWRVEMIRRRVAERRGRLMAKREEDRPGQERGQ